MSAEPRRRQKVAVLGYGVEGRSAYRFWSKQGADITICDAKADLDLPAGVKSKLGPDYLDGLDQFDLLVRSPGVKPGDIRSKRPVTSVTREFMAKCPVPIIGVTGTKGKGTTSTLITKMLEASGKKVWLGGNIGTPALDFLDKVKADHWVVLELSSFQLMDVTQSPHISVVLMISPDHLNYHGSMSEYLDAKGNIFRYQKPGDRAVYNAANPEAARLVKQSLGDRIPYGQPDGAHVRGDAIWFRDHKITTTNQVGLIGRHNLENICAAVAAVWDVVGRPAPLAKAIKNFTGLPHRLQEVRVFGGVRFIDDSFAVNPLASVAALRSLPEPKVVIMGGLERGIDLVELTEAVPGSNVREVVVIGQTGPKIKQMLNAQGFAKVVAAQGTMRDIVKQAWELANEGDTLLLSPGCASFDMFKDYEDRGDQFQAAVKALPA